MFTGIVAAVGRITAVVSESSSPQAGVRVTVDAGDLSLDGVGIGDSIALAGACMTDARSSSTSRARVSTAPRGSTLRAT